jgi:alpha-ketoglutarate-dependent taurine dioxygenase
MSETILRYEPSAGSIGCALELESLESLTSNTLALADLLASVNERGVVCVRTKQPATTAQLAVIERCFGVSGTRGTGQPLVAGTDFLGDFSVQPKLDDGRPRKLALTDFIHIDTMANGPAAYGVHVTLSGCSVMPMRFTDMRALYAAQPVTMKQRLAGLRARHTVPARAETCDAAWTLQPLAARHPRTGAALLLLPNRYDRCVAGLPDHEAAQLIAELWRATDAFPDGLEIPLQPHTLVIWDNITCTHTNPSFPRAPGRVVWFFNVLNDRPVEPLAA